MVENENSKDDDMKVESQASPGSGSEHSEVGEYGVEQILADEQDLAKAREKSGYHYSHDELEHKADRFTAEEPEPETVL